MHISFDTATAKPAELQALSRFIQELATLGTAPVTVTTPAAPERDRLDAIIKEANAAAEADWRKQHEPKVAGKTYAFGIAPADRPDAGTLPADDLNAAAVFGGQHIGAAPAVPSVPVVPTVPAAPSAAAGPASVTAPSTTAAAPPAGVDVDKTGLPWDPRIHTGTKAKNADGTWRQRRGLNDEALLKRVEAELRATMALPAAPAAPTVPNVPVVPTAPPSPVATEAYLAGTPAPAGPATFGEFMVAVSNLVKDGKISADAATTRLQSVGFPSIMALASRPDMIPTAWQALNS